MNRSQQTKSGKVKDVVCGMDVSSENARYSFELNDATYYFCASSCREKFEKSPGTYLKKSSFFLKRWWDDYLVRLNKITDGKPRCCS